MTTNNSNRWLIAAAGVVMQLAPRRGLCLECLSNSTDQKLWLDRVAGHARFRTRDSHAGFAAFAGGLWMKRSGLAAWLHRRPVLRLGPRARGTGREPTWACSTFFTACSPASALVLSYIVPVATLIKWFPDKRGMITGIASPDWRGALITAPVAQHLISWLGVSQTFTILGVTYFIAVSGSALLLRNPPDDYRPPGWQPAVQPATASLGKGLHARCGVKTWQWYGLWAILFLNTSAGISIISQAAPMAQENHSCFRGCGRESGWNHLDRKRRGADFCGPGFLISSAAAAYFK